MMKTTPCGKPYAEDSPNYYHHVYSDHCKICKRERPYEKIEPTYIGESVITPCGSTYLARSPQRYYKHIYSANCKSCKKVLEILHQTSVKSLKNSVQHRRSVKSLNPKRNDSQLQKRIQASKYERNNIHSQKRKLALTVEDEEMDVENIRPPSFSRAIVVPRRGFRFESPSSSGTIVPRKGFSFESNYSLKSVIPTVSSTHPLELGRIFPLNNIGRIGDNIVVPTIDHFEIIACSEETSYLEIVNNLSMIRRSNDLYAKVRFEVLELINLLHGHIYEKKILSR